MQYSCHFKNGVHLPRATSNLTSSEINSYDFCPFSVLKQSKAGMLHTHSNLYKLKTTQPDALKNILYSLGVFSAECNASSRYFSAAAYSLLLSSIANAASALSGGKSW